MQNSQYPKEKGSEESRTTGGSRLWLQCSHSFSICSLKYPETTCSFSTTALLACECYILPMLPISLNLHDRAFQLTEPSADSKRYFLPWKAIGLPITLSFHLMLITLIKPRFSSKKSGVSEGKWGAALHSKGWRLNPNPTLQLWSNLGTRSLTMTYIKWTRETGWRTWYKAWI